MFVGVGVAVLGAAGLAGHGYLVAEDWKAALAEVSEIEARFDAHVDERPALWGETRDGAAYPHYDRALSLVPAGPEADSVFVAGRAEGDQSRRKRAALVAAGAAALGELHLGAHAADATRSVDWSRGFEVPIRSLRDSRRLLQLCEMQAAMLFEEGRELEAVGVLLDALQFAGDLSQAPILLEEMIGVALLTPELLVEGVADGTLLELPDEAGQRLVEGVRALDRRLDWPVRSLDGELILGMRGLDAVFRDDGLDWRDLTADFRETDFGLTDGRRYAIRHLEALRGSAEDLERAFGAGPSALLGDLERLEARVDALGNPLTALIVPKFSSAYRGRLASLGRFRLLAHALSGSDTPEDPWLAEYLSTDEEPASVSLRLDHAAFGQVSIHVPR